MKDVPRVDCEVDIPSEVVRLGEAANAFRVMSDDEGAILLDFCAYQEQENHARVVSRVRITPGFLPLVSDRIREALRELVHPVEIRSGLLVTSNGKAVLLGVSGEEQ